VSVFGVAYAAQEMNQVIKGPFDQPLDAVVTEQGIISFNL
jgi:5-formyltetrahydrofolate cyclo-ligase